MFSPGISSRPVAKSMIRVRWSKLKFENVVKANGSRKKVTESKAIAWLVFVSVSSVGDEVAGVIVKFGNEMLKKMLSAASTLMRAVEVGVFGRRIVAAPLFGTPDASEYGKLMPPSIESSTRTNAQLMGALDVFATFQVTV